MNYELHVIHVLEKKMEDKYDMYKV